MVSVQTQLQTQTTEDWTYKDKAQSKNSSTGRGAEPVPTWTLPAVPLHKYGSFKNHPQLCSQTKTRGYQGI